MPNSLPPHRQPLCPVCRVNHIKSVGSKQCGKCRFHPGWHLPRPDVPPPPPVSSQPGSPLADDLTAALKHGAATLATLAERCHVTQGQALDVLLTMQARGVNVCQLGEQWSLERIAATAEQAGRSFEYRSRSDNTFRFGVISDRHVGSKYARLDVARELYRWFAAEGVDRVFDGGNWIDGESRFNRLDLAVYGLEPQVEALIAATPNDGLVTYAIHGDDHEGWYGQREAVDMGRFVQRKFEDAGRHDWIDLGFMEGKVDLVNATSGERASLLIMHPGSGSAYAVSYKPQKIVEAFSGGEKPGVVLIGHYHKMECLPTRNVWSVQMGCCQDQTPFMRKRGIEAVVGGAILTLEQDPQTGAIVRCVPDMRVFYVRAYYNDRWSKVRPAVLPTRAVA